VRTRIARPRNSLNASKPAEKITPEIESLAACYTKGASILLGTGWRPGQGLGKRADGMLEPLKLNPNLGRFTIGFESALNEAERALHEQGIIDPILDQISSSKTIKFVSGQQQQHQNN
jgi:hypothetical protein